jgi:hypothetical protein
MMSSGSVLVREQNVAGLVPGVPEREESRGSTWTGYEQEEVGFEKDRGWACLVGRGRALPARGIRRLAGGRGDRGRMVGNKMWSGCSRESRGVGRIQWREDRANRSRSTTEEDAEQTPARCSTLAQHSEHA